MAQGLTWNELEELIFPDLEGERSINEMMAILTSEPFAIKNENNAETLSRYLCEENSIKEKDFKYFIDYKVS